MPASVSSESLPNAEEEVEVACLPHVRRYRLTVRQSSVRDDYRINRRIQVIAQIKAQWTDRRVVTQSQTYCVREVVKVAEASGVRARMPRDLGLQFFIQNLASPAMGLFDADKAGPDIGRVIKDVAHVVKQHEAQGVVEVRQLGIRGTELSAVYECARAADWKAGERVAGAGSVDGKAAQRLRPARIQALRQRDVPVLIRAKGAFI